MSASLGRCYAILCVTFSLVLLFLLSVPSSFAQMLASLVNLYGRVYRLTLVNKIAIHFVCNAFIVVYRKMYEIKLMNYVLKKRFLAY
jgi:hypothetical protein